MQAAVRAFSQGGECMCIISLVFAVGIAVFAERFVMLFVRYNINAVAFMSQIQKLVFANNIDRAIKLCNAAPTAALSRVIKAGLLVADGDLREINGAVDEAACEVVALLGKRARALLGVAAIAACLGVLGVAVGVIRVFSSLDQRGPEFDLFSLGDGLAASMYPLAFGIAVATLALVAHFAMTATATRIGNEISRYSVKLSNILAARQRLDDHLALQGDDRAVP